jgi:hypothetical protein
MKTLVYIPAVLLLLTTGCKKEGKLTPSEQPEKGVYSDPSLPQGNHPYDADILQLFQKYSTFFLYKYIPNDLYFNINTYTGGTYDPATDKTTRGGYFDVPANEAYVGMQLDMLKDIWLKYYPDTLLKKGLPQKVYLLDSLYYAYPGPGKPVDNWPEMYDTYWGNDFIAVAWGGTRIQSITKAEKYTLKGTLNALFLTFAHKRGAVKRSTAFTSLTDYKAVTYTNYRDYGIIDFYRKSQEEDWNVFMETIVSNSYAALTAPGGVLHPGVDTKGVIRKKYDIVIAYFQSVFGVDLQAIGNAGL